MPTVFLYCIEVPADLLGYGTANETAFQVYYAYHADDSVVAAPSFSYMLVL